MDVIAKTKCVCYSISVNTLKAMVGEKYRDVLYLNFLKMAFQKSYYFTGMNLKLLEEMYDIFQVVNFGNNEVVLNEDYVVSNNLIIVIEGALLNVNILF